MTKKDRRGWHGEHRRHVLAGKGVNTVLPDGRRLDVSRFVAKGDSIGIDFQSVFSSEDRERIEHQVWDRIAEEVEEGCTGGELFGEEPEFNGWFDIEIEEDDSSEDVRNREVARLIREGYTSGYYPSWSYSARVWRDD